MALRPVLDKIITSQLLLGGLQSRMSAIHAGASTAVTSLDVKRVAPQCCVDVRFGSKADILGGLRDVRFASNSGHPQDKRWTRSRTHRICVAGTQRKGLNTSIGRCRRQRYRAGELS